MQREREREKAFIPPEEPPVGTAVDSSGSLEPKKRSSDDADRPSKKRAKSDETAESKQAKREKKEQKEAKRTKRAAKAESA